MRPGNAGGGKGPWFKTGAGSSEAREIGATLLNSDEVRELRKARMPKRREDLSVGSGSRCRRKRRHWRLRAITSTTVRRGATVRVVERRAARDLPCAKAGCLVREPDAGNPPVRFDEGDVETELGSGY